MSWMPPFDGRSGNRSIVPSFYPDVSDAGGTVAYIRGGSVHINLSLVVGAAMAPLDLLIGVPGGYLPAAQWFGSLVDTAGGVPISVCMQADGAMRTNSPIVAGRALYGSITYPVGT